VPQLNIGHYISVIIFLCILSLSLLHRRFWCAYLCPSGALLSIASMLRLTNRKIEATCVECGKCISNCTFDAIEKDYSTRILSCTFCQSCGGVCPTQSIQFVSRWNTENIKSSKQSDNPAQVAEPFYARRGFLVGIIGAAGGAIAAKSLAKEQLRYGVQFPVRPPGAVPEEIFRQQCIRCGECLKACPGNVLQPAALELGLDGLWTPKVTADWSGCKPYCNNCGNVCPTGAIRALPIEEKRAARIGLAVVNKKTCLPNAGREECGLCEEECSAAGYNAIEFIRTGIEYDQRGTIIEGSGFLAPVVLEKKCVGCGLCQAKCYATNVKEKKLLEQSAIKVEAGPGKEDRVTSGSYLTLQQERINLAKQKQPPRDPNNDYLPDFLR
jgi:ferredoxin